jgi:membrane fusion protein, multidrug efflux system
MMNRNFATRSLAVVLAGVLFAVACSKKIETAPVKAASLPDDVKKVAAADPPAAAATDASAGELAGEGKLAATGEFISPVRSELVSKEPGRVGKVYVDAGAVVRQGEPLLELESETLQLEVKRSEAELARAKAAAADAERDFARKTELKQKSSIPQALYDRSQSMSEQAQATAAAADAALAIARQRLADAILRSPINGVVVERRADVGERLGDNTIAFILSQTAPLKLRFRVPERYIASLHRGQNVRASVDAYPGEWFNGVLSVVGQVVDPSTRTFFAEAEFPNRDGRLRPGLFAHVQLDVR